MVPEPDSCDPTSESSSVCVLVDVIEATKGYVGPLLIEARVDYPILSF